MATPADIVTISTPGNLDFPSLLALIKGAESNRVEFVYMEAVKKDGKDTGDNLIYFEIHAEDVVNDPITIHPIPPGLTEDTGSAFVDQLIDQGINPFSNYFDVYVAGKLVSLLPCRVGSPPPLPANLTGWVTTMATVFGLNMDGSIDTADNGQGAPILGRINTRDPELVGCALPIPVLRARFGSLTQAKGKSIRISLPNGSKETEVKIVDLGPSNAQIKKGIAIDLTLGAMKAIGGDGLTKVRYHL